MTEPETKGIIVEEVARHMEPLTITVARLDKTLRSLYSNGSGGPPGYLERSREEDRETFKRIFGKIEDTSSRLEKVEEFIFQQKVVRMEREKSDIQRNEEIDRRIARQNILIAFAALIVAVFMAILGWRDLVIRAQIDHRTISQDVKLPGTYVP